VYNRGVAKQAIFLDDDDYRTFLNLLKRYLDVEPHKDMKGREYKWLHNNIELLAYCLMPNHFHLLLYQIDEDAMKQLMSGVATSYSTYFNKKYKRVGHLFQERYKASEITNDSYLQHISRYIHRNPKDYKHWAYSSLSKYHGTESAGWLRPSRILDLFDSMEQYTQFVDDYTDAKDSLDIIQHELANY